MIKDELVREVSRRTGIEKNTVIRVLENILGVIGDQMAEKEEVILAGFGHFKTAHRASRQIRDLRSKELIEIPERDVIQFKADDNSYKCRACKLQSCCQFCSEYGITP